MLDPQLAEDGDTVCEQCGQDASWSYHPHAHPKYVVLCPDCGPYEPEEPFDEPDPYYADE